MENNKEYKEFIVKDDEEEIRIDKLISKICNSLSRVTIQRMIENENILVNGKKVKTSYKAKANDKITIFEEEKIETNLKPQELPLDIIYEDNDLIIVNKEKGMVVHPGNRKSRWNFSKCDYVICKRFSIRNWWKN